MLPGDASPLMLPPYGRFYYCRRRLEGSPRCRRTNRALVSRHHHAQAQTDRSATGMSTTSSWTSRSYWPAKGFTALFDYTAASIRGAALALVLGSPIAFLPGRFQIPPVH